MRHWIESGQPKWPWSWPDGRGSHGSSFFAICELALVKIEPVKKLPLGIVFWPKTTLQDSKSVLLITSETA